MKITFKKNKERLLFEKQKKMKNFLLKNSEELHYDDNNEKFKLTKKLKKILYKCKYNITKKEFINNIFIFLETLESLDEFENIRYKLSDHFEDILQLIKNKHSNLLNLINNDNNTQIILNKNTIYNNYINDIKTNIEQCINNLNICLLYYPQYKNIYPENFIRRKTLLFNHIINYYDYVKSVLELFKLYKYETDYYNKYENFNEEENIFLMDRFNYIKSFNHEFLFLEKKEKIIKKKKNIKILNNFLRRMLPNNKKNLDDKDVLINFKYYINIQENLIKEKKIFFEIKRLKKILYKNLTIKNLFFYPIKFLKYNIIDQEDDNDNIIDDNIKNNIIYKEDYFINDKFLIYLNKKKKKL